MSDGKMNKEAAGRIQGAEARANEGKTESGGFAARAQAAAAKNAGPAGGQAAPKKWYGRSQLYDVLPERNEGVSRAAATWHISRCL